MKIIIIVNKIAIADANPILLYLNAVSTVRITNVSLPFPPPVIIYGASNTLKTSYCQDEHEFYYGHYSFKNNMPENIKPVGAI